MVAVVPAEPQWQAALESCRQALRRIAGFTLDSALETRLRDLGERKEFLSPSEHGELLALVAFTRQRSQEKLEAELALRRLQEVYAEPAGP